MNRIPEDPWMIRAQSLLVVLSLVVAMILGADIIYHDAILHPPIDPATSGLGTLLLGAGPVRWYDGKRKGSSE